MQCLSVTAKTFCFCILGMMVSGTIIWMFDGTTYLRQHKFVGVIKNSNDSITTTDGIIIPQHSIHILEERMRNLTSTTSKWFVYLVQTPQCLPPSLLTNDFVGNETLCHCDVIVLSYQNECNSSLFYHIEYLHLKHRTTWTQGRNLLWLQAKRRRKQYIYYIFMDDDIELRYNNKIPFKRDEAMSPLRAFEKFLLNYEPVVGVVNFLNHVNYRFIMIKRHKLCKETRILLPVYVSMTNFDALFNAFHYEAIDSILPYNTKYDKLSWWHSQRYIITKVEILFRGQAVMFTPVYYTNKLHRPYPRNNGTVSQVWTSIVEEIEKKLPIQYREMKLVKEFKSHPFYFLSNSQTICLNLPAHFPIVPFQHFSWKIF